MSNPDKLFDLAAQSLQDQMGKKKVSKTVIKQTINYILKIHKTPFTESEARTLLECLSVDKPTAQVRKNFMTIMSRVEPNISDEFADYAANVVKNDFSNWMGTQGVNAKFASRVLSFLRTMSSDTYYKFSAMFSYLANVQNIDEDVLEKIIDDLFVDQQIAKTSQTMKNLHEQSVINFAKSMGKTVNSHRITNNQFLTARWACLRLYEVRNFRDEEQLKSHVGKCAQKIEDLIYAYSSRVLRATNVKAGSICTIVKYETKGGFKGTFQILNEDGKMYHVNPCDFVLI